MDLRLMPLVGPLELAVSQSSQHLMSPSHTQNCQSSAQISQMSTSVCGHKGPKAAAWCTNQWLEEGVPHTCLSLARSGLLTEEVPRQSLGQEPNPHGPHNRSTAQEAVQAGSQACSSDSRLA